MVSPKKFSAKKLLVGFDADDTLWHNEDLFVEVQGRLAKLVGKYTDSNNPEKDLDQALLKTERQNLDLFGYGIKAFTLAMLETAVRTTDGKITAQDIAKILDWGKEMFAHPIELLDGVAEIIPELAKKYKLALITKGELFLQETRIEHSGLAEYFSFIEILSNKTPADYQKVFDSHQVDLNNFIMVGNSLYSDILPIIQLGGHAIHIPYPITWELEQVPPDDIKKESYLELENISGLPVLLEKLT